MRLRFRWRGMTLETEVGADIVIVVAVGRRRRWLRRLPDTANDKRRRGGQGPAGWVGNRREKKKPSWKRW